MSTINEIEKKRNIPLRRDQAVQKEKLKDLIVTWADEGRFNEEERAALLDRIKPQLGRKKVGESN